MGYKGKIIWLMFFISAFLALNSAEATEFLNVTEHLAYDNNSYIFIENAMQMPNGSFAMTGKYLSAYASRTSGEMSRLYFVSEIWANTSATWASEPVRYTSYYKNEDNKFTATRTYYIYKTNNFLNSIDCGIRTVFYTNGSCYYADDGVSAGSGVYSFLIRASGTDVANYLNVGVGFLNPTGLESILYGWTWQDAWLDTPTGSYKFSETRRLNTLIRSEVINADLLGSANNSVTEPTVKYYIKWRGYYQPHDLGIAIVDNTTFATVSNNNGLQLTINSSDYVAYRESAIKTTKEYIKLSTNSPGIYDMELNDALTSANYNQILANGNYYLLVFQKRQVVNDQYYILLASKSFNYNSAQVTGLQNLRTYSFDMNGHKLLNFTSTTLWLGLYDWNINEEVNANNMQSNYLDIQPYFINSGNANIEYLNYSVYTSAGSDHLSLRLTYTNGTPLYDKITNNKIYIPFKSASSITSNSYYSAGNKPYIQKISGGQIGTFQFWQVSSGDIMNMTLYQSQNSYSCSNTIYKYPNGTAIITLAGKDTGDKISHTYVTANISGYLDIWQTSCSVTQTSYFFSNIWITSLSSISNASSLALKETAFSPVNTYTWRWSVEAQNDLTIRTLWFYVDDNVKNTYTLQPNQHINVTITWLLSNGNHILKTEFGDKQLVRQVYATNSSLNESQVLIDQVNDLNVTAGTTYTSGSVSNAVSGVLSNLVGTWAITPYIIALFITLVMAFYTRNVGVSAIAFMASLFIFVAMGWITDAYITSGIVVSVCVIMGLLIYKQFNTGAG